jgi:hypothetical protein
VTTPAIDRLSEARATARRRHLETMRCAALLQEAVDRAERWYARRADVLRRFDRSATASVRHLVADARVQPSLAWSRTGTP